jgi:DNA-binding IclR family transcriptional regulator
MSICMYSVFGVFCDYLPDETQVFDGDRLAAAAVVARDAWIEALGFTPAERDALVRKEDARAAAARAREAALTDEEREEEMFQLLADCRHRRDVLLGGLETSTAPAA